LRKLKNHIRLLMRLEDTPDYVVIHIGGNGIRDIRVGHFHYLLVRFMSRLAQMMPQTGLIWSAILPRLTWKYSDNNDRM
jgi:lysophospholipase L1-like esterase